MRTRRVLVAFGGALLLGWGALRALTPTGESGAAASGALAPFDSSLVSAWEEVARLTNDDLLDGRVRGVDARGDTLYVLQSNHWLFVVDQRPSASFGTATRGAPDWLGRGTGIAAVRDSVIVLDDLRQLAAQWSLDGQRGIERDLRSTRGLGAMHQRLVPLTDGAFAVTSVVPSEGAVEWVVTRHRAASVDTLVTGHGIGARGGGHDEPHVAPLRDGSLVIVDANSWRVRRFGADGALLSTHRRADAPRWALSDSARRKLQQSAMLLGPGLQNALAIDATLPPVRAITATADDRLIVLSAVTMEATHAELVARDGTPITSLWARPEEHPVFLARGALYRVRALDEVTIIERQRLIGVTP